MRELTTAELNAIAGGIVVFAKPEPQIVGFSQTSPAAPAGTGQPDGRITAI